MEINVDLRTSGFQTMLSRLSAAKADAIVRQTFNRVTKSVRAEVVKGVRQRFKKIPQKEAIHRITINKAARRFRIYGAGTEGNKFIRPRWLGLDYPGRTKRGKAESVTWTGLGAQSAPRSFVATVLPGTKLSKSMKAKAGRIFAFPGGSGFDPNKAVVFQREPRGRRFRAIRGTDSMGEMVDAVFGRDKVRAMLTEKFEKEMVRRIESELKRA